MGDLVAARLALLGRPAQAAGRLRGRKTRCNAVAGGGPRHAPCPRGCGGRGWRPSRRGRVRVLRADPGVAYGRAHARRPVVKASAHLGLVAVADRLDQQITKRPALELKLAEDVEYLAAEGLTGLLRAFPAACGKRRLRGFLRLPGSRGGRLRSGRCGGYGRSAARAD